MPQTIIDFHAHIFPDAVAETAIPFLAEEGNVKAFHDGKLASLIESMDTAGIDQSVVCCIATKPSQFKSIFTWCQEIGSERIVPFPSVHPDDRDFLDQLGRIRQAGFQGIKMHPYYQDFFIAEERMLPIYKKLCQEDLILVMHTGFDIAFPRVRRAAPEAIRTVTSRFPDLKMVTTHLGAWEMWDEVEEQLIGRPIYMDISYSLDFMEKERARKMIMNHPPEYVLFGTDSPWADQKDAVKAVWDLDLGESRTRAILGGNAARLLASAD